MKNRNLLFIVFRDWDAWNCELGIWLGSSPSSLHGREPKGKGQWTQLHPHRARKQESMNSLLQSPFSNGTNPFRRHDPHAMNSSRKTPPSNTVLWELHFWCRNSRETHLKVYGYIRARRTVTKGRLLQGLSSPVQLQHPFHTEIFPPERRGRLRSLWH